MRKLIALTLILALHLTAFCQIGPVLVLTNNNGNASLSWSGGPQSPFSLQATTDLSPTLSNTPAPIAWSQLAYCSSTGTFELPATNSQQFFRLAPIISVFQFAIFYNMDLEIAAASTLTIQGPVFSNAGFWSGSTTITFSSSVSAVGVATNSANDPFCAGYSGSGKSTYSLRGQPTSGAPPLSVFGLNAYTNPAAAEAFLNLPSINCQLGTASAFSTNGQFYIANAADLYVTNYPSGTNWGTQGRQGSPLAVYYSDGFNASSYLSWVTNDFYIVSNVLTHTLFTTNYIPPTSANFFASGFQATNGFKFTNSVTRIYYTNLTAPYQGTNCVVYMGYSFLTNVLFYDWREGWHGGSGPAKTVQAVQLDLVAYNKWMTNVALHGSNVYNSQSINHKRHPIDSIYIYNAVPLTSTVLPAVRVMNGGSMPSQDGSFGFTLATPMPLYVWGDYNATNGTGSSLSQNSVIHTEPAALMADAITVLSDNWLDSFSQSGHNNSSGGPNASQTTVNAAILAGIVKSDTNNFASNANGYSGGVENYFRLLENWIAINLWYNGSMVAMFPCQYATNCWQQTGGYYTAASRKWAFNTNYLNWNQLPPLTPTVINYITP